MFLGRAADLASVYLLIFLGLAPIAASSFPDAVPPRKKNIC